MVNDLRKILCFLTLENPSPYFPTLPPWHIFLLAALGLTGIIWGWRNTRWLPWSAVAFLLGIALWAYALYYILPWTISL